MTTPAITSTTSVSSQPVTPVLFRQQRLSRGWEPIQMIGRMKITADRLGLTLPPAWLLIRWVFLWENHRAELPPFYAALLDDVFAPRTVRNVASGHRTVA